MHSTLGPLKLLARFCFLLSLAVTPIVVAGQELVSRERALIAAAREIINRARYGALITMNAAGELHARAMDPFEPTEDMVIWFGTNPNSRKVAEIRHNPRVSVYYFDAQAEAYVTIYGTARLVNDPKEKLRHWKDEWKAFYPDREKDYLLIAVTPERLEVVNEKKGITGDSKTWDPPTVKFRTKKPHHSSPRRASWKLEQTLKKEPLSNRI